VGAIDAAALGPFVK